MGKDALGARTAKTGGASMAVIGKHLLTHESDEARVLGYFQRLNQAGYDTKGQVSVAHGQAGIGFSLQLSYDFGEMVGPFIHFEISAKGSFEFPANTLVVLERHPTKIFQVTWERPPQPPTDNPAAPVLAWPKSQWRTDRPLSLTLLRGRTKSGEGELKGTIWAGLAEPFGDEGGLGIGVSATGNVRVTTTRLVDPFPRHYAPSAYSTGLAEDVDDLFEDHLKKRAVAWIVANGGRNDLAFDIASRIPDAINSKLETAKWVGGQAEALGVRAMETWEAAAVPEVELAAPSLIGTTVRAMADGVKLLYRKMVNSTISTAELKVELVDLASNFQKIALQFDTLAASAVSAEIAEQARENAIIARLRIAESRELFDALDRRRDRKQTTSTPPTAAAAAAPLHYFDIESFDRSAEIEAAAVARITNALWLKDVGVSARAKGIIRRRNVNFRWQSAAPHQRSGRPQLITTRDTVINYHARSFTPTTTAAAKVGKLGASNQEEESPEVDLGSMGYRSVSVNWFSGDSWAKPNGSGVSFGASVLHSRLVEYVELCRLNDGFGGLDQDFLTGDPAALEAYLVKELHVRPIDLRRFAIGFEYDFGDLTEDPARRARILAGKATKTDDESVLIEAGFAFITEVSLSRTAGKIDNLFVLPQVIERMKNPAPKETRLQVIRARFRCKSAEEQSRDLFALGLGPKLFGKEDPGPDKTDLEKLKQYVGLDFLTKERGTVAGLATQIEGGLQRIKRVSHESILDLHVRYFPAPFSSSPPPRGYGPVRSKELSATYNTLIEELAVPPVVLFGQ